MNVVFLGAGNMAEALVAGLLREGLATAQQVCVTDVLPERRDFFVTEYGVSAQADNRAAVEQADVVVLAVKPQVMKALLEEIRPATAHNPLFISIAAGLPLAAFESVLGSSARIVRAMPNTPALVGRGIAAICGGQGSTDADLQTAEQLLGAVGQVVRVDEPGMDAVTAVSGSGPAYIFYVMEAMLEAASRMGLADDTARALVLHTVAGAAALALQSDAEPGVLRQRVTSKGGTTAAALAVMDEEEIRDHLITAMLSAQTRAQELAREWM